MLACIFPHVALVRKRMRNNDSIYSEPQASPATGRMENQWDGLQVVLFFLRQLTESEFNKSIVPIN